jgi:TRAP transporter 4TM/12TM fusion protein
MNNSESILEQNDQLKGSSYRQIARWIAILFALVHIYTAGLGSFPDMIQRSMHVSFAIILTFAVYPAQKKYRWIDLLLVIGTAIGFLWIVNNYNLFATQMASAQLADIMIASFTVIALLETSRRVIGIVFPLFALMFILYVLVGEHLPGFLGHAGYSVETLIEKLYMGTSGLWGTTTSITSTTVAIFIIFGVFLLHSGGGKAFIDIGAKLAGTSVAGPPKVAVISSSLFGLFSGSAAANASVVGNFTINLMKRLGYTSEYAAGVEAAASSGGQIAPPIMGAAAFVMAEFLGVSYLSIAIAAIFPAFFYYLTLFLSIHFDGKRENHRGIPEEMIPKTRDVLSFRTLFPFVAPVITLITFLMLGYTEGRAGFWAVLVTTVIYVLKDFKWHSIKKRVKSLLNILEEAGKAVILIALLAGVAQILVGILGMTGLGVKISAFILSMSGGLLLFALLLSGLVVIVLGMGMPTTAAYVLGASICVPALTQLNVVPIAAHMFVLYYAVVSAITPPVCAAVFVSSGLAQSKWFPSAIIACKLGLAKFIVPLAFVYSTGILLEGSLFEIVLSIFMFILASLFLSMGTSRYIYQKNSAVESCVLVMGGLLLFNPIFVVNVVGFVLGFIIILKQRRDIRAQGGSISIIN